MKGKPEPMARHHGRSDMHDLFAQRNHCLFDQERVSYRSMSGEPALYGPKGCTVGSRRRLVAL